MMLECCSWNAVVQTIFVFHLCAIASCCDVIFIIPVLQGFNTLSSSLFCF